MSRVSYDQLLEAGAHFGHLKSKWNPKMAPYIFMERNGIHVIDLNKTVVKLDEAAAALKQIAKSGKKILFVATKKQAKDIVSTVAKNLNMPYVTERWPGGMCERGERYRGSSRKPVGPGIAEASTDPGPPAVRRRMPISSSSKDTRTSLSTVAASQTPALE